MKREQVSIRLKPTIKSAIEKRAKTENRSVSQMIETILEKMLQQKQPAQREREA